MSSQTLVSTEESASRSTRRTIWIHLGTHKTGTTSIQAALARNRDLLGTHGVYVPRAGTTDPCSGHHGIAWAARGDRRYRTEFGDLGDLCRELSVATEPVAVISSEALGYLVEQGDTLRHMESALRQAGWEPHYLIYLRRQADYAASLWKELGKHGLSVSYARFVVEILLCGRVVTRDKWVFDFDFARFLERWRAATTSAIQARAYEHGRPAAHLIRDFLLVLGIGAPAATLIAEQTPVLNVGERRRPGLFVHVAAALLTARFVRANARLQRSWHVDLNPTNRTT